MALGKLEQFWLEYMSGFSPQQQEAYIKQKEATEAEESQQAMKQAQAMTPPVPEEYRALLQQYNQAAQAGQKFGMAELEAARGVGAQQAALADALRAQAEGRGESIAAKQYQQALQQSQAAIQSQLASARGLSPAQAQRIAARQQAAIGATAAGQSSIMRLQEQQAAQAALGNLLGQQRQQALLGGQVAGTMGAQSGGLGMEAGRIGLGSQQMTANIAQNIMGQQQAEESRERKGKGSMIGTVLGGAAGFLAGGPAGAMAGAKLGGSVGENLSKGGQVDGQARYRGDTRSNDTVPAMLSPGEIVLPRTVAQSPNAPDKAKKFVEAIKKNKRPSARDYTQALSRLQELESRMDAMEALADLEAEQEG